MKKLAISLAASAAVFATPALAQLNSSTESFEITADVPQVCAMEDINDVALGTQAVSSSSGAGALELLGTDTGSTNQFYISCNDATTLTLSSANQGLLNTSRGAPVGDDAELFTNKLFYNLRLNNFVDGGNGAQPKLATKDTASSTFSGTEIHRQVSASVTILPDQNPLRPLAGDYEDTATVAITTI